MTQLREALDLHRGQIEEAERSYRDALEANPADGEPRYRLGVVAAQAGKHDAALRWFSEAVQADRSSARYQFGLGRTLKALGDLDGAIACYRAALSLDAGLPDVLTSLGVALRAKGQVADAVESYRQALSIQPNHAEANLNLGNALGEQGDTAGAIDAYRVALQLMPATATVVLNLGVLLERAGRNDEAIECFRQLAGSDPDHQEGHLRLGALLRAGGSVDEALHCYGRALNIEGKDAEALYAATHLLRAARRVRDAAFCAEQAFALRPADPQLHFDLGNDLSRDGYTVLAEASYRRVVQLDRHHVGALTNLAVQLQNQGRFSEALEGYMDALKVDAGYGAAWRNLAALHQRRGRVDQAVACCRKAVELAPGYQEPRSSLLMNLNYVSSISQEELTAAHVNLRMQSPESTGLPLRQASDRPDPERRLRLGLVSPDLRDHSVAYFLAGVLARRNHAQFEVFCYYLKPARDPITSGLRGLADHWREAHLMGTEELGDAIRQDGIDILVDLAGHTSLRADLFNQRCAPVQVTWLGYPTTTGLMHMDYRITDWHVDPPGWDRFSTEKLIRLDHSYYCYTPLLEFEISPDPPCQTNGFVTFGTFNNIAKISDDALALWARILRQLPRSRLTLKAMAQGLPQARQVLTDRIAAHGIELDRVTILDWMASKREHTEAYNQIDIALDTVPYNGATTTCEALWMGIPVVSLVGRTHAGRMGLSVLSAAGLPELVAGSPEQYVRTALDLANRPQVLAQLRQHLRGQLASSPLLDARAFTAGLEDKLRRVWRHWCSEAHPR